MDYRNYKRVVSAHSQERGVWILTLECGHKVSRRQFASPAKVKCEWCVDAATAKVQGEQR